MRDQHRMKEKYELSLESRQIVTLTVAALVVLGGVFVLGVVVGKKLATEQGVEKPAPDLLTAIDEKSTAMENVQKDAALTFQDELTKKAPSVPALEAPKPEPKPVAEEKAPEPAHEEPKPEVVEPTPVAEPVKVAEAKPEPKPEPMSAKTEKPKLAEQVKEEPIATRTRDAGALKEAFGKATAPASGQFALQLSAYQDRTEAERLASGLRDKGYAPYIVEAKISGKGTWYRVRMGRFPNREAASKYLSDFKRETSMDAIVTTN